MFPVEDLKRSTSVTHHLTKISSITALEEQFSPLDTS